MSNLQPAVLGYNTLTLITFSSLTQLDVRSADRNRRHRRTGRTLQLQRLHDERELVGPRLGEVLEHEILKQMDTIDSKSDIVDRQTDRLVRIGRDLDRPVICAKQHRVLL